jgi:hypothetical protein
MSCAQHQMLFGWSNQGEWEGRGMWHVWGRGEVTKQGFGGEIWGKKTMWKI